MTIFMNTRGLEYIISYIHPKLPSLSDLFVEKLRTEMNVGPPIHKPMKCAMIFLNNNVIASKIKRVLRRTNDIPSLYVSVLPYGENYKNM